MRFGKHIQASEILREIRGYLDEVDEAVKVTSFESIEYGSLRQVTFRAKFMLPSGLAFHFYVEHPMAEPVKSVEMEEHA